MNFKTIFILSMLALMGTNVYPMQLQQQLQQLHHGFHTPTPSNNGLLLKAAYKGFLEAVQYFIQQQGTNINVRTVYNNTPLHLAASRGHLNIVQLLVRY